MNELLKYPIKFAINWVGILIVNIMGYSFAYSIEKEYRKAFEWSKIFERDKLENEKEGKRTQQLMENIFPKNLVPYAKKHGNFVKTCGEGAILIWYE